MKKVFRIKLYLGINLFIYWLVFGHYFQQLVSIFSAVPSATVKTRGQMLCNAGQGKMLYLRYIYQWNVDFGLYSDNFVFFSNLHFLPWCMIPNEKTHFIAKRIWRVKFICIIPISIPPTVSHLQLIAILHKPASSSVLWAIKIF